MDGKRVELSDDLETRKAGSREGIEGELPDRDLTGRIINAAIAVHKALEPVHFAIVRSCLKAADVTSGLLLNFAAMPLTVKRVGRERPQLSS